MAEIPRRLVESTQSKFPTEWNKMVGNFEELSGNGSFNLPSPMAPSRELRVQLSAPLYRDVDGDKVTASPLRWNGDEDGWQINESAGDIDVYPETMQCGYFFEGQHIAVIRCSANGRYYPKTSGVYYCTGVAAAAFDKGSIGNVTVAGLTIEAYAKFGDVPGGAAVGLGWDDVETIWMAGDAECEGP